MDLMGPLPVSGPGDTTDPYLGRPGRPNEPVLRVTDVVRRYGRGENAVTALDGVSLDCRAATWTAVMGPSGSGKSTLLHCAAGLEPPTSGSVWLAGTDLAGASEATLTELRRTTIGFVFQSFNLVSALTAEQNVTLPLRLAGRAHRRRDIADLLARVGLDRRGGHKPRQLSGGQQQRVALARALVTRPAVLFADEPTGALDSTAARTVLELIRTMVDTEGQTVLMVTHDPGAAAHADEVVFVRDGRIVEAAAGLSAREIGARLADLEMPA